MVKQRAPLVVLTVWIAVLTQVPSLAQSTHGRESTKAKSPGEKVVVRVESPYVSEQGHLVLVYTVTNNTGQGLRIGQRRTAEDISELPDEVTIFLKLREPSSYSEVSPQSDFLVLPKQSLPMGLPVRIVFLVQPPKEEKSSWFSGSSGKKKIRQMLDASLGNVESVLVSVPARKLKISFPIPK